MNMNKVNQRNLSLEHASDDESQEHDEQEIIKIPHNIFEACMA